MSGESEKELSDIELCYKAIGLSFSDNPDQVEKTYRKLKDEYGKAMRSSDTAERTTATENLRQLEELFSTITGSLIYKDYAREYERYKALKAEQLAERKQKQLQKLTEKEALVDCPYCGKLIDRKLKVCIYCRGKILTPMEKFMTVVFSRRNMIILGVLVVIGGAAIMALRLGWIG